MKPLKILFASIPFDGHFNPLTGIAEHLKNCGHDVRWYTQQVYEQKLSKLEIPHYPFKRTVQYNQFNLDQVFSERLKYSGQIKRLNLDLQNVFVNRAPEFYLDIKEINETFPFDIMIADVMFTAIPLVKAKLKKPVITIGVVPLVETSKHLPPAGLGMTPSYSTLGRLKQKFLRFLTDKIFFGKAHEQFRNILGVHGLEVKSNTMDYLVRQSTYYLQSGTPGFEYRRSDLGQNIRFIGALLPATVHKETTAELKSKLHSFKKVILVTQGTIEKNPEKLIVPVLEAFKNSSCLVVVTTGGSKTQELRDRYTQPNIIIEDFIPFGQVLPYTSVFITNGGYGGVMLGIENNVPMVVAGIHEGKNEINARVGYFKVGINLKTETPSSGQIRKSVEKILADGAYKSNVKRLGAEFRQYNTLQLCEKYVNDAVVSRKQSVSTILELQH